MNLKYFTSITDISELKQTYRALTKKYHPDLTGDNGEAMKAINAEYDWLLKNGIRKDGESLSDEEIVLEKNYREVVEKTVCLEGLLVELCGRWLWFTGQTYRWKGVLKQLGCQFAHKKSAWYWRPDDAKVFSRNNLTLEEIRCIHGSKKLEGKERVCIA